MSSHFPPVLPVNKIGLINTMLSDGSQMVNGAETPYQVISCQITLCHEYEDGRVVVTDTPKKLDLTASDLLTQEEKNSLFAIMNKIRADAESDYLGT